MKSIMEQVHTKSIQNLENLKGKKVLVRVDVNTSLGDNGAVDPGEDWRIIKAYQSIDYLVEKGACVILISHIGREVTESLKPIYEYMSQHITLGFLPHYDPEILINSITHMQHGSVIMLENLRQHAGEKENNSKFLDTLVDLCDVYVNDAFSVSHRKHASVHDLALRLPAFFGLQFVDEIDHLSQVLDSTGSTTLVLGGAKFGTKLDLLGKLLPQVDYALIGGALANVFLRERGIEIGKSFVDDVDISSMIENEKIIVPVDAVDQHGDVVAIDQIGKEDMILDIGPETEKLFETIIAHTSTGLWNGPMGKYEDGYVSGSVAVADSVALSGTFSVTGGGDTATVILEQDLSDSFDFISTGGGAMLDFLVDGTLPGIDIILNKE
jgi:3-phosphoglycerate kinase